MYFYIPNLQQHSQSGTIQGESTKHLLVMRVRIGQELMMTDLQGFLVKAKITESDKKTKTISFQVLSSSLGDPKPSKQIPKILFQALLSKEYMDKLYEVIPLSKFDQILLFRSFYSTKDDLNYTRLHNVLVRSCEQSERVFWPLVKVLETKSEVLETLKKYQPQVLDCAAKKTDSSVSKTLKSGEQTTNFLVNPIENNSENSSSRNQKSYLVGPEGGWSDAEREFFGTLGLESIFIGSTIYPAWIAGLIAGQIQ
jgi:RsmE family RNA methyltransferase